MNAPVEVVSTCKTRHVVATAILLYWSPALGAGSCVAHYPLHILVTTLGILLDQYLLPVRCSYA